MSYNKLSTGSNESLSKDYAKESVKTSTPEYSEHDVGLDSSTPRYDETMTSEPNESHTFEMGNDLYFETRNWRESNLLKAQIIAAYAVFILFGLAEQAVGTMIPKFQDHYKISDIQVSFIFLSSVFGYFLMGLLSDFSHRNLGIRGVVTGGSMCMTLAYFIISHKPPFFILLICFAMNGIGLGSLDASLNTWMGALEESNQLLGILHGCYGVGSMLAPPIITHLLEKSENPWTWNQYYSILAIVGLVVVIFLIICFRRESAARYHYLLDLKHQELAQNLETISNSDEAAGSQLQEVSMLQTLHNKVVILFALILFIYVGAEVAFGAWMITFLTRIKSYSYKVSSYMATSFWAGLTVGRIVLGFATAHYFRTELTANFTYILVSLAGTFIFWLLAFTKLVPLLFIAVFVTGMAVGPIFPTTIVTAINVLPVRFQTAGVGFICAFGGGGAAVLPFLVGLVAESSDTGLAAYPLIVTAAYGLLSIMWVGAIAKHSKNYGNKI